MDWFTWIPAGTLALLLWLGRNLIATRLKASVEHEFKEKLEEVKADLQAKENQIAALQSGALTGLASRQAALDTRRLQAVDDLWTSLQALKALSETVDTFRLDLSNADRARPYVSDIAWALFSAYKAIVLQGVVFVEMWKRGTDPTPILDTKPIAILIKAVLPESSASIDKWDSALFHRMLEPLENRLLTELRSTLKGTESDEATVKQAASILKLSVSLIEEATPKSDTA
jgi:hypothetical protein